MVMPPDNKTEREQLHVLMLENQRLLSENNQLLKKMNKRSVLSFWIRLFFSAVFIGLLVFMYFYFKPYITSLGSSFQSIQDNLQEVKGWSEFYDAVGGKDKGS